MNPDAFADILRAILFEGADPADYGISAGSGKAEGSVIAVDCNPDPPTPEGGGSFQIAVSSA